MESVGSLYARALEKLISSSGSWCGGFSAWIAERNGGKWRAGSDRAR
jgi:hypothetical protein